MALPDTRNTTYAPGSQVKSVDLNAIQDQIIALDDWLTGERAENAVIDGDLLVDKLTAVGDVIAGDDVLASGDVVASGSVVATQDLIATGDVKFGTARPRWTHAAIGWSDPAQWAVIGVTGGAPGEMLVANQTNAPTEPHVVPVVTEIGETIASWGALLNNTDATATLRVRLFRQQTSDGLAVQVGEITRAPAAGRADVVQASLNHVVQPGAYFAVVWYTGALASSQTLGVGGIHIDVKRTP